MLNGESGRRKYRNSCYYFGSFSVSLNFKMEVFLKKNLYPQSRTLFQDQEQSRGTGKMVREAIPRSRCWESGISLIRGSWAAWLGGYNLGQKKKKVRGTRSV